MTDRPGIMRRIRADPGRTIGGKTVYIGIVIHSITGNTFSVAERIQARLHAMGHEAVIERIRPMNKEPVAGPSAVKLANMPSLSRYDALIFGSPVQAFALDPVMKVYLAQVEDLTNRKTICFLTQQLPFRFFAGNRSLAALEKLCRERHGSICQTGIVNWGSKDREQMITDLVEAIAHQF